MGVFDEFFGWIEDLINNENFKTGAIFLLFISFVLGGVWLAWTVLGGNVLWQIIKILLIVVLGYIVIKGIGKFLNSYL